MTKRHRRIADQRQLEKAAILLAAQCEIMADVHQRVGAPPIRDFTADFAGLAQIIVGQQLSAQSAAAIWGRISGAVNPLDAPAIVLRDDAALRGFGLSSGKVRTLRALARAVLDDGLDVSGLHAADDAVIIERLTAIHGIGPWTADIFLLFALRRADAFASGDLALQLAAQRLFKLNERPSPAELDRIAERWRPWRAVAARLLWADYAVARTSAAPSQSRGPGLDSVRPRSHKPRK